MLHRFSSKEEKRRVVANVLESEKVPGDLYGFENHLNYFHKRGAGLDLATARGLAAYLNSTLVDSYFRQFNGHTQVNATDMRNLTYPTLGELQSLGSKIPGEFPTQAELDELVRKELLPMSARGGVDPVRAKRRADEVLAILKELGLPRQQMNDRSALTLLALLDLKPDTPWLDARDPLRGITPMMEFFDEYYGKKYKPNTRETVRRQTVHQFLDAGLIIANPDLPERPVNSPKAVYRVEQSALALFRSYGARGWAKNLRSYLASVETLKKKYAQEREMARIPISTAPGRTVLLSPGGQNVLVEKIVAELTPRFTPRFTPGGKLLYVGDTDEKFAFFDPDGLATLNLTIEAHGKMPDVIVHHTAKDWLVLIEAVTSHGPIDPKRRNELLKLFSGSSAGLVFVTAFLTRKAMVEYLNEISWETEVWMDESSSHMIHFNGEKFLGPYSSRIDAQ